MEEKALPNLNNTFALLLKKAGSAQDITAITRALLKVEKGDGTFYTADSSSDTGAFDWTPSPAVTGKLVVTPKNCSEFASLTGKKTAHVFTVDLSNTDGIWWGSFVIDFDQLSI